jgi:hypothetical protein
MNERSSEDGSETGATPILAAVVLGFFVLLLLPSLSPHYGFYSDELYYLACAKRLAFGYVDHPPFFVFLLRLHQEIFGDSLMALRALPAAAAAATAFLAGWMARRLGGGTFAQVLAALCVMASPATLAVFSMFTVNCTGILLWTAASWVLLELCRSRDPRLWIPLGALLGIALLNKHTAVVPIAGLAVGTLLTPLRSDLRGRWPWLGALAALAITAPNLVWQIAHDWPSLAFYSSVEAGRYTATLLQQLEAQIIFQNPAAAPIWASGAFYLLRSPSARPFRPLGWLFVAGGVLTALGGSLLPYRMAGVYPVVFAGGAVLLEHTRTARILAGLMLVIGLAAASFILPILPPESLAAHPLYDVDEGGGFRPEVGRNEIPYHLGNRTHWKSFVETVAEVSESLDADQRETTILLVDYFGHAGAIERHGRGRNLPPVYSPMTGYFLWGPPEREPSTVVAIGVDEAFIRANFDDVRVAATFRCTYCPPVVDQLPILVATGSRRPFAELWPEIGRLEDRRTRMLAGQEPR